MEFIFKFLINTIISLRCLIRRLTTPTDYSIIRKSLEYEIDKNKDCIIDGPYWEDEYESWNWTSVDEEDNSYFTDITHKKNFYDYIIPDNISKAVTTIKYWYNNKIYKMITYEMNPKFPPDQNNELFFHLPIKSIQLLDKYGNPVKDIYDKVMKYAGPFKDFHGYKVKLMDVLYNDEDTLKEEYPKVKVLNLINQEKILSTIECYINELIH